MDNEEVLKESSLCSGLNSDELKKLAQIVRIRAVKKDTILFFEGDKAEGFFLLLSGKVKIYKVSRDGKEHILHHIYPGQIFAEVAIFHGEHFPANCMALENSEVTFFPKLGFIELIEKSPQISLKIIASLSAFLRDFSVTIENLSLKEVPSRIATYLLDLSRKYDSDTVILDSTKTELAKHLGTLSETLSRGFRKLIDNKTIVVDSQKITILDPHKLEEIAEGEKI